MTSCSRRAVCGTGTGSPSQPACHCLLHRTGCIITRQGITMATLELRQLSSFRSLNAMGKNRRKQTSPKMKGERKGISFSIPCPYYERMARFFLISSPSLTVAALVPSSAPHPPLSLLTIAIRRCLSCRRNALRSVYGCDDVSDVRVDVHACFSSNGTRERGESDSALFFERLRKRGESWNLLNVCVPYAWGRCGER